MTSILIDNQLYEVNPEHNLLQAMLSLGLDLPYFCWHPALGSVGSCRQCAVTRYNDENDSRGRMVMACMTPVEEGMRVGLADSASSEFRAVIIEALMSNHPHDCPVCEEGGECHLQDMTVMSGHTFRRYRGLKRTHRNQYLGPFINHEMNRCIACYRCVRFYRDYAGGTDLSALASHNHVYFGRERDGVLESAFSGNLTEVCPTGVFTDKTFSRHFSRKWDQQTAPSVCMHCAVGCNTTPAERYGRIVRITNRFNQELNGYFLCDRGRFGYDFSNAPERLSHSYRPVDAAVEEPLEPGQVLAELIDRLADPQQAVFGLGSPRASLEDNFALRHLVDQAQFFAGIAQREWQCLLGYPALAATSANRMATVKEIEHADAALVIGEDLGSTAPRVALALRQMTRNEGVAQAGEQGVPDWQDGALRSLGQWTSSPLWQLVPHANALSAISANQLVLRPGEIAAVGFAIAELLEQGATAINLSAQQQAWAEQAAEMLGQASKPVLLGGSGLGDADQIGALAAIAAALRKQNVEPGTYFAAQECNSVGLAALTDQGLDDLLAAVVAARQRKQQVTLVILENDLQQRLSAAQFEQLREGCQDWLVLDYLQTPTTERADAVLAMPSPFERQGTYANASGQLQGSIATRYNADAIPAWQAFARALATHSLVAQEQCPDRWRAMAGWLHSEDVRAALQSADEIFAEIGHALPDADYREQARRLARQSHRYSGRTAMAAQLQVAETPPPKDEDSPYAFSMEGSSGTGPGRASIWAPRWNSNQALNKFQEEVGGDWRHAETAARLTFPGEAAQDSVSSPGTGAAAANGAWTLVPRYEVFGSESLSNFSAPIRSRMEPLMLSLDAQTARELNVGDWDSLDLCCGDTRETLYLSVAPELPERTLVLPVRCRSIWAAAQDGAAEIRLEQPKQPLPRPQQMIATDRRQAAHE